MEIKQERYEELIKKEQTLEIVKLYIKKESWIRNELLLSIIDSVKPQAMIDDDF